MWKIFQPVQEGVTWRIEWTREIKPKTSGPVGHPQPPPLCAFGTVPAFIFNKPCLLQLSVSVFVFLKQEPNLARATVASISLPIED